MRSTFIHIIRRMPGWYCWYWLLAAGMLSQTSYAQAVGDYRTMAGGVANFNNRTSWERWNGSQWVANSGVLDLTKTFTIRHSKNVPVAGVSGTVARIVLETDDVAGTVGTLNVNGRLVCTNLQVSGVGTQVTVKDDDLNVTTTTISDKGVVTLMSSGNLGKVNISSNARLELQSGVGTATMVGPVTVGDGGVVRVAANGPTLNALTVADGGQVLIGAQANLVKCQVEAGGTLLQQATGQIQVVRDGSSSGADLLMQGQLRNESNAASVALTGGAVMQVKAGAVYTHAANGGILPIGSWDPASTLEITGVIDASGFANDGQIFGNIIWNTPDYGTSGTGSNVFYLNNSGNMRLTGKLTVRDTGLGRLQLTPNTGSGTAVTTQLGGYEQLGGQVCVARFGSALSRTVEVGGDFVLSGGRFELSNSSSSGPGILKVTGSTQLSNGTLLISGGVASGTLNLLGDLTLNSGADLRREITGGNAAVNFIGTQLQRFGRGSGSTITGPVDFEVFNGASLDVGSAIIDGDGDFTLNAGGTLLTGHAQGLAAKTPVNQAYTGSIQVTGSRSFSAGASYTYNGSTAQITGMGLPTALISIGQLILDNGSGPVTLSRATSLAGTLRLRRGRLLTTTNLLTLLPTASWAEASDASYVDGPLARQTNNTGTVYTFPTGAGGRLKVGGVRPSSTSNTTFQLVAYTAPAPSLSALATGSNLYAVSRREYWELTRTAGTANATARLYYTVPYSDIQETPAGQQALRIAVLSGGQWQNYGQAALPNTAQRYLDAGQVLTMTTATPATVTFGTLSPVNPLPVTLTEFRGKTVGSDVQLNWTTAQELNCAGYEVQVSDNGSDYVVLDYYNGRGSTTSSSHYGHLDRNAFRSGTAVRYYRLRQIDTDGKFWYSPVVAVAAPTDKVATLELWPVPATDWLNIRLAAKAQDPVTVRVLDAGGRLCQTIKYTVAELPDVVRIPVTQLHRGLYFVQVETKQSRGQVRFLKE